MKIEAGMVAVITGAGSGIGRALAEKAAQSGMRVVAADIEQPRLDDTVAALTEAITTFTDRFVSSEAKALEEKAADALTSENQEQITRFVPPAKK